VHARQLSGTPVVGDQAEFERQAARVHPVVYGHVAAHVVEDRPGQGLADARRQSPAAWPCW